MMLPPSSVCVRRKGREGGKGGEEGRIGRIGRKEGEWVGGRKKSLLVLKYFLWF